MIARLVGSGLLLALTLVAAVMADERVGRVVAVSDGDTSILLMAGNRPGALFRLLELLARNNVSMNRIESRPSLRRMGDYVFFIDPDGHVQDKPVATQYWSN